MNLRPDSVLMATVRRSASTARSVRVISIKYLLPPEDGDTAHARNRNQMDPMETGPVYQAQAGARRSAHVKDQSEQKGETFKRGTLEHGVSFGVGEVNPR